jgi:hypothetical protein
MDDPVRRCRARRGRALCVALLVLGAGAFASGAEETCAPWLGEPAPLPRVSDSDPVLARWAELRAAELMRHAELAEPSDRPESHRLWQRVLCLDPDSEAGRRGLTRSHPVRIHRPAIVSAPPVSAGGATLDPWHALGDPLVVTGKTP